MRFNYFLLLCVFVIVSTIVYQIMSKKYETFYTVSLTDATEIDEDTYKTCGELQNELQNDGDNYQEVVDVNGVKYCANCPVGYGLKYVTQDDISCQKIEPCEYIPRRLCYYTINDSEGFDYFTHSNETDQFSPCVWFKSKELIDTNSDDIRYVLSKRQGLEECYSNCPNDPKTGERRVKVTDNRTNPPTHMCVHHSKQGDFETYFSTESTVELPEDVENPQSDPVTNISCAPNAVPTGNECIQNEDKIGVEVPENTPPPPPATMWRYFWDRLVPKHETIETTLNQDTWEACSNALSVANDVLSDGEQYNGFIFHPTEKVCQHIKALPFDRNGQQEYEDILNNTHSIRGMFYSYDYQETSSGDGYIVNSNYVGNKKHLERWFESTSIPSFEDYLNSNVVYQIMSNQQPQRIEQQEDNYLINHSEKQLFKHVVGSNIDTSAKTWKQCLESASNSESNAFYFKNDKCVLQHVFGNDRIDDTDETDINITTGLNWDETYNNAFSNWSDWTLGVGPRYFTEVNTPKITDYIAYINTHPITQSKESLYKLPKNQITLLEDTLSNNWETCAKYCRYEFGEAFEDIQGNIKNNPGLTYHDFTLSNTIFQYSINDSLCTCFPDEAVLSEVEYIRTPYNLFAGGEHTYVIGFTGNRTLTEKERNYMDCSKDGEQKCDVNFYKNEILKDNSKWYKGPEPNIQSNQIKITIMDYQYYNHFSLCSMKVLDNSNNHILHTIYTFGHLSNPDSSGNVRYPNEIYPTTKRTKDGNSPYLGTWHSTYSENHEVNDYFLHSGFVIVPIDNNVEVKKLKITGVRAQRIPSVKVMYKNKETDTIIANSYESTGHIRWIDHMQSVITVEFDNDNGPISSNVEQTNQHNWCDDNRT